MAGHTPSGLFKIVSGYAFSVFQSVLPRHSGASTPSQRILVQYPGLGGAGEFCQSLVNAVAMHDQVMALAASLCGYRFPVQLRPGKTRGIAQRARGMLQVRVVNRSSTDNRRSTSR